ncbi:MAG: hypothetical protein H6726_07595 [Sandaracinaceae bacterium]|nr:hypothetical protein [Myxococcales bacterium]MCB9657495.1 hypothetical protein [Sandaracinaceae bacterium]
MNAGPAEPPRARAPREAAHGRTTAARAAAHRRSACGVLAAFLLLTASGCEDDPSGADTPIRLVGDGAHVRYLMGVSWEGAVQDDTDDAYLFTSDEGVEVRLTALWFGVGAVELVPCEPDTTDATVAALRALVLPGRARADHVWVSDGTLVEAPTVLDALDGQLVEYGGGTTTEGTTYCGLYQRAIVAQDGLDAQLVRQSLRASGTYRAPSEAQARAFDVSVDLLVGSTDVLARDELSAWLPGVTDVVITYEGARAFDGVQPETLSERGLAYELLRNVIASARVSVRMPLD